MAEPGERKPRQPKPKPEKDDRPQADRFIETARQLGADETGERFEKAFEKMVPSKERGQDTPNQKIEPPRGIS